MVAAVLLLSVGGGAFLLGRTTSPEPQPRDKYPDSPAVATSTSTTSPTATTVDKNGRAGGFAGRWKRRGAVLDIDPTGYGVLTFRTDTSCGADVVTPCDITIGTEISSGGFANLTLTSDSDRHGSGEVLTSAQAALVPTGHIEGTYDASADVITITFSDGAVNQFCGPAAEFGPC